MKCLRAIEVALGTREQLADLLGVTSAGITAWHKRNDIPARHLFKLVEISDGKFTVEELVGVHDEELPSGMSEYKEV